MRRRRLTIGLTAIGVLAIVVGIVSLARRDARSVSQTPLDAQGDAQSQARVEDNWAAGPFTSLAGRNLRADLDRYLMLELRTEVPPEAEQALRTMLTAFLRAYSGTDFARYLEFRRPEGMCALDDARLQPTLAAWSPEIGPVPTDTSGLMASAWRLYVSEGMGPVQPGPIMDAVAWPSCRATLRYISKRDIVAGEWDETAPGAGLLQKEVASASATNGPHVLMRPAVPNAISVPALAKRDGSVLCADFNLVCRAARAAPRRLVLRFVWDGVAQIWLPLHALVYGGSPERSFIW